MNHSYQTSEILRIDHQYSVLHQINNSKTIGSSVRFLQFTLLNKVQGSSTTRAHEQSNSNKELFIVAKLLQFSPCQGFSDVTSQKARQSKIGLLRKKFNFWAVKIQEIRSIYPFGIGCHVICTTWCCTVIHVFLENGIIFVRSVV